MDLRRREGKRVYEAVSRGIVVIRIHPALNETMKQEFPDRKALAALGQKVRERLARDPSVYRLPVEDAEIFAVGDFLDADECDVLVRLIDDVARPSTLYKGTEIEAYRTSYSGDVPQTEPQIRIVERRLSDLLGIDLGWGETVQGQRYAPGQEYRGHCDWFDVHADYWKGESRNGGQRSWTAMAYLNNVEEGGETEFTQLGFAIPPQRGSLVFWNNALPDGRTNPATLHAAKPVVRGVKYVITKWFRTRPWLG